MAEAKFLTLFSESDNRHQLQYFFAVLSFPPRELVLNSFLLHLGPNELESTRGTNQLYQTNMMQTQIRNPESRVEKLFQTWNI